MKTGDQRRNEEGVRREGRERERVWEGEWSGGMKTETDGKECVSGWNRSERGLKDGVVRVQETREEDDGSDGNSDCDVRGMKARKDEMKRETMDTDISGRKDGRKENRGDAEKKEGRGKTRDRERQTKRRVDEAARSGGEEKEGNNELS